MNVKPQLPLRSTRSWQATLSWPGIRTEYAWLPPHYFADLDGHLREAQWNLHLEITDRGEHLMKR